MRDTDTLITPDGAISPLTPADPRAGYSLEELQAHVGGSIQLVPLWTDGVLTDDVLIVNEVGAINGMPLNALATACHGHQVAGPLFGIVLVIHNSRIA